MIDNSAGRTINDFGPMDVKMLLDAGFEDVKLHRR
jgi:hypothetical protein